MQKKSAVRLLVALGLLSFGIPQVDAYCFYPRSTTAHCYKHCYPPPPPDPGGRFGQCVDGYSEVGECTTDCDGNTVCSGITENCDYTIYEFSDCPAICE